MYGVNTTDPKTWKYNPEVGKIVAGFHLERVERVIKEVEGKGSTKVLIGGSDKIDK